jgi:uncharacterized membrane protein
VAGYILRDGRVIGFNFVNHLDQERAVIYFLFQAVLYDLHVIISNMPGGELTAIQAIGIYSAEGFVLDVVYMINLFQCWCCIIPASCVCC